MAVTINVQMTTPLTEVAQQMSDLLTNLGFSVFENGGRYQQVWGSSLFFGERDADHRFHGPKCGGDGYGWYVKVYWSRETTVRHGREFVGPGKPIEAWFGTIDAMTESTFCDHAWGITPNGIVAPTRPYFSPGVTHAEGNCWCAKHRHGEGPEASAANLRQAWDRLVEFMIAEYKAANAEAAAVAAIMDFGKDTRISDLKSLARQLKDE